MRRWRIGQYCILRQQGLWFNPDLQLLSMQCFACSPPGFLSVLWYPPTCQKPLLWIGNSKLALCVNGVPSQLYSCLKPYVLGICARSTATLTTTKQLLKLNEWAFIHWLISSIILFTFYLPDNHHHTYNKPP